MDADPLQSNEYTEFCIDQQLEEIEEEKKGDNTTSLKHFNIEKGKMLKLYE